MELVHNLIFIISSTHFGQAFIINQQYEVLTIT